jgi:hypothetical protein
MLRRQTCAAAAALLLATASIAHAMPPEPRLVDKYSKFAGSESNAHALVTGLRNDTQVRLDGRTRFTPPTDPMGYGNVDISLALAKATLAGHGIRNPTSEEIKAALVGGTITAKSGERVKLPGVLTLRAQGLGWGQIAQKHGFKLGEVMGDDRRHAKDHRKHAKDKHRTRHDNPDRHGHSKDWKHARDWKHPRDGKPDAARPKHHGRPDFVRVRAERPDFARPHKVERPHRPERPERPERPHRGR